jgi:hypothetical protein
MVLSTTLRLALAPLVLAVFCLGFPGASAGKIGFWEDSPIATRGGPLTSAYRYVGPGEARIIEKTGLVPNTTRLGQPKNVSLTPQESASQVEEALAVGRFDPRGLGVTPTHGVQVDLRGAPLSYGGTGGDSVGGIEVQTPAAVRALRVFELEP